MSEDETDDPVATVGADDATSGSEEAPPEEQGVDPDPDPDLDATLDELWATVEDRQRTLPEDSYTATLLTHEKGTDIVLEKLGEETTELILAAKDGDADAIAAESADLVYHLLVLLAAEGMTPADLQRELRARF